MTKTVLVVVAHSDDEALGCGGTIAKHHAQGDNVHVVYMTNGVGARSNRHEEGAERHLAALKAGEILGVKQVSGFGFPDNQMDSVPLLEVVKAVEGVIAQLRPSIVYTHFSGDLNVDHQRTHAAVMTACRPLPSSPVREIYSFEVVSSTEWSTHVSPFRPTAFVDISDYMDMKMRSLNEYDEEMRDSPHSRSYNHVNALAVHRGNSCGVRFAEAFQVERILC
jgi:LmbE family N-acetylglucosaminyl deacetylase